MDRFLGELDVKIIKVGEIQELPLGTEDAIVAKFAKNNDCVVITRDDKLVKQCQFYEVKVITLGMDDLARKVIKSLETHLI